MSRLEKQSEEITISHTLLPSEIYEGDTGKLLYLCCLPIELPYAAYALTEDLICHVSKIKHKHIP